MAERTRGWWYPWIMMGVLGVVMVVNMVMAYFATSTFNGVITDNAYEKGVTYNRTLEAARNQSDLHWNTEAAFTPGTGHAGNVVITFQDKNGHGVDGLEVQALVDRPNVTGHDKRVGFTAMGGGKYAADVTFAEAGQWDFDMLAFGKDVTYQFQRRFVVP